MKLSEETLKTILIHIHKRIEEAADKSVYDLVNKNFDNITYPPNGGLTDEEIEGLRKLDLDNNSKSGLRKIIADNSAFIIFDLLCIIDGVGDPEVDTISWTGIKIVDDNEDIESPDDLLHDRFYETYWDWRNLREDKGWKLDNHKD